MAINRPMQKVVTLEPGLVCIAGSFQGASTSTPVTQLGKGVSVAWSATGTYVLTLPGTGTLNIYSVTCNVERATGGYVANVEAKSNSSRTVTINVQDLDTPVDTDLVTGEYLHYMIFLKNSSAG